MNLSTPAIQVRQGPWAGGQAGEQRRLKGKGGSWGLSLVSGLSQGKWAVYWHAGVVRGGWGVAPKCTGGSRPRLCGPSLLSWCCLHTK